MKKSDFCQFGIVRKTIPGKGEIFFTNSKNYPMNFNIVQYSDGQLLLFCEYRISNLLDNFEFGLFDADIFKIVGKTINGNNVDFSNLGPLIRFMPISNSNRNLIITILNSCKIGDQKLIGDSLITFDILNFLFIGPNIKTNTKDGFSISASSQFEFLYNKNIILIKQVPNYQQVLVSLTNQKGKEITSQVIIKIINDIDLYATISVTDHLCELLSIVRSTLINWVSFEVTTFDGKFIYAYYQNAVSRNFNGTELINRENYLDLKNFLETALLNIDELNNAYNLRRLARSYTETRGGPFLETRTMLLATIVEYLANIHAEKANFGPVIDENLFLKRWNTSEKSLTKMFADAFPEIDRKKTHEILIEIKRSINQRSFNERIDLLTTKLSLPSIKKEIKEFVKVRNSLVHSGSFPKEDSPFNYYKRMQHFLDQIILKLFNYSGNYYDIEHNETRNLD